MVLPLFKHYYVDVLTKTMLHYDYSRNVNVPFQYGVYVDILFCDLVFYLLATGGWFLCGHRCMMERIVRSLDFTELCFHMILKEPKQSQNRVMYFLCIYLGLWSRPNMSQYWYMHP